jgi:hypothetical protein
MRDLHSAMRLSIHPCLAGFISQFPVFRFRTRSPFESRMYQSAGYLSPSFVCA